MSEPSTKQRLADLSADCLSFVAQLRSAKEPASAAALRQQVDALLKNLDRAAQKAGIEVGNAQLARYAIVALVDEIVLSSHWALRQEWTAKPLQLEYFNEFTAGQGFFTKIESLRNTGDPAKVEVLEVFALCLGLGFRGRYADMAGMETLKVLRAELAAEIRRARQLEDQALANAWQPEQRLQQKVKSVPIWIVAAACGGILLLVFFVLDFMLGWDVSSFETTVKDLTQ